MVREKERWDVEVREVCRRIGHVFDRCMTSRNEGGKGKKFKGKRIGRRLDLRLAHAVGELLCSF
jgi:hypothetical protein